MALKDPLAISKPAASDRRDRARPLQNQQPLSPERAQVSSDSVQPWRVRGLPARRLQDHAGARVVRRAFGPAHSTLERMAPPDPNWSGGSRNYATRSSCRSAGDARSGCRNRRGASWTSYRGTVGNWNLLSRSVGNSDLLAIARFRAADGGIPPLPCSPCAVQNAIEPDEAMPDHVDLVGERAACRGDRSAAAGGVIALS